MMATTYSNAGRRSASMRRAMADLHAALDDAHSRLQHAKASPTKPAVSLRAMMVG